MAANRFRLHILREKACTRSGGGTVLTLLLLTVGCLRPAPAAATPLAAPSTQTSCFSQAQTVLDPIACAVGGAHASVQLGPVATVAAEATNAGATAALEYQFEVVGGNIDDLVPVLVSAYLETNANGASQAQAGIVVTVGSTFKQVVTCSGPTCSPTQPSAFSGDVVVTASVGTVNRINLNASVAILSIAGTGYAIADPFIRIDPSFAQAANYSIELSDGVANAVPEPGTSALFGGAIAGLAWRRRRMPRALCR